MPLISIKKLAKSFGNVKVLNDISLDIEKGDVVTIIGSSGSGKSTLLRCINLLERPTNGSIIYNGEDLLQDKININMVRSKLQMVFQNFNLFNNYNVLDNCIIGQTNVLKRKREDAIKIAKENLIKVLNNNTMSHSYMFIRYKRYRKKRICKRIRQIKEYNTRKYNFSDRIERRKTRRNQTENC